jgi:D-alanyl-D-alanine carboxypeptidase (penicillin-binding protein 5/6)
MAKAALIMDAPTGRVVFQRNAHQRLAPASITKIMTAIVALEKATLSDKVIIQQRHLAEDPFNESVMGLMVGDIVTLEDLLWGLLLTSGNDAARAIADHVGGSSERFIEMMNDKASELGLKNTHFTNPHGLDEEGHFSSAYDLAVISRYALANPTFAKIVASKHYVIQASRSFQLQSGNQLLYQEYRVPGVNGVKTGFTENAGDCLVASVSRAGHQVIVVVMGAEDRVAAAIPIIDYAFNGFTWLALKAPAGCCGSDVEANGCSVLLSQRQEEMIPRWQKYYLNCSVRLRGDPNPSNGIGVVSYSVGGVELAKLPLVKSP